MNTLTCEKRKRLRAKRTGNRYVCREECHKYTKKIYVNTHKTKKIEAKNTPSNKHIGCTCFNV